MDQQPQFSDPEVESARKPAEGSVASGLFALSSPRAHEGLFRLRTWIAANGALSLDFRRAATIACLEPHYFSSVFHKHVGITFVEWRRRQRVAFAIEAIERRSCSIAAAAHLAGYRDRRSLERAIKSVCGWTPAEIKRNLEIPPAGSRNR